MLIERPPGWFRLLFPGALFRLPGEEGRKRVFLTFDDGPVPEATPMVLETLDKFDVKATFFMVGQNIERYPDLFHEVVERGHAVGNHTLHHLKGLTVSRKRYLQDVEECARLTGSKLFRPPHGIVTPGQLRALKKEYTVVMYDLVTRDYSKHLNASQVVRNVQKFARDGSIIVFHDSIKSLKATREALPKALDWLLNSGFKLDLLPSPSMRKEESEK